MTKKILGAITVTRALVVAVAIMLSQVRVVPNLYGMAQAEAIHSLESRGLQVGPIIISLSPGLSQEHCTVIASRPSRHAFVLRGTPIRLVVSGVAKPRENLTQSPIPNRGGSDHGRRC